jgi:hypothetical protein
MPNSNNKNWMFLNAALDGLNVSLETRVLSPLLQKGPGDAHVCWLFEVFLFWGAGGGSQTFCFFPFYDLQSVEHFVFNT